MTTHAWTYAVLYLHLLDNPLWMPTHSTVQPSPTEPKILFRKINNTPSRPVSSDPTSLPSSSISSAHTVAVPNDLLLTAFRARSSSLCLLSTCLAVHSNASTTPHPSFALVSTYNIPCSLANMAPSFELTARGNSFFLDPAFAGEESSADADGDVVVFSLEGETARP